MPYNITEVDGVIVGPSHRFPVEIYPEAHNLNDTTIHLGKVDISQLPDEVMLESEHQSDPHTMIIDGRDVSIDGSKLDTIQVGAEVNNLTDMQANSLTSGLHSGWHHHDDFYYRETELQTPGESAVHWLNLTNVPDFSTNHTHDDRYYTESEINTILNNYYTSAELNAGQLNNIYYTENEIDSLIGDYYTKTELDGGQLDNRYYTETELNTSGAGGQVHWDNLINVPNFQFNHNHDDRYYTESEIDAFLALKSDVGHTHDDRYYTKSELDGGQLDNRYYTETEVDNFFVNYYDQTQIDNFFDAYYSKTELNNGQLDNRYFTESEITTNYYDKPAVDSLIAAASFGVSGSVDEFDDLPTPTDEGVIYIVKTTVGPNEEGFYRWNGSSWDFLANNTGATTHGSLPDLGNDDHPQYTAHTQDETITGNWSFENGVLVLPNGATTPTGSFVGEIFWDSDDDILYVWNGSSWDEVSSSGISVYANNTLSTDHVIVGDDGQRGVKESVVTIDAAGNVEGVNYLNIQRSGDEWMRLDHPSGNPDLGAILVYKYTNAKTTMDLIDQDDGPVIRLLQTGSGTEASPQYLSEISMDNTTSNIVFSTEGSAKIEIENDGTLSSRNTSYETLVTDDDDIPNKKYVDDAIALATPPHNNLTGLNTGNFYHLTFTEYTDLTDGGDTTLHHHDNRYFTESEITTNYYSKTDLDSGQLDNRYYTKTFINGTYYTAAQLNNGQLDNRYYTETEINGLLSGCSSVGHIHDDRYYTESEIDTFMTLYYSAAELDGGALDGRYYTENEINAILDNYYTKAELDGGQLNTLYYTKAQLDSVIDGSSGADIINITPLPGGAANTVQGALEELASGLGASSGTLDEAYDFGSSGAGREIIVDSAPVKLNSTSGTDAPLELTNRTSVPSTNLAAGQVAVIDGIFYVYDETREKWLTPSKLLTYGRNNNADGTNLKPADVSDFNSGYRMPRKGTIVSVTLDSNGPFVNGKQIYLIRNSILEDSFFTNSQGNINDTSVDIDFNANDELGWYVSSSGSPLQDAVLLMEVSWRA